MRAPRARYVVCIIMKVVIEEEVGLLLWFVVVCGILRLERFATSCYCASSGGWPLMAMFDWLDWEGYY